MPVHSLTQQVAHFLCCYHLLVVGLPLHLRLPIGCYTCVFDAIIHHHQRFLTSTYYHAMLLWS